MDSTGNVDCCGYLMATTWWCAFDWYRMTEGFQSMGVLHMDRVTEKPVTPVLKAAYLPYFKAGGITTGVEQKNSSALTTPERFVLHQNYPNPFNPSTHIVFRIPNLEHVALKIYDINGREVATLFNELKAPGTYEVIWDAGRFASGVYFYRLSGATFSVTKKLVLVR